MMKLTHALAIDEFTRGLRALLSSIGEDPDREGLRDTPKRVFKALVEMTDGADESAEQHLKVSFDSGDYDEVVLLRDIEFSSVCEHHLLPFSGVAHVAYLPSRDEETTHWRVVGLSKLARVVAVFARRLQMQERITSQVADALVDHLKPRGVAVVLEATHSCLGCRGALKAGASMVTSATHGGFRTDSAARAEVMAMIFSQRNNR